MTGPTFVSDLRDRMSYGTYQPPTSFSVFPPVIKNLLILNGLLFLAQIVPTTDEFLRLWFALWPLDSPELIRTSQGLVRLPGFMPWQLITYGFLHASFSHLFFNMFALWMFGMQVENAWGSRRFATFYFVCVAGAGLIQLLVATLSAGPAYQTLGASGGVFGILLAFGMMYPETYIMLLIPPIPIKAKYFVIGYGVLTLIFGVTGVQNDVAHFAHLGGMIFGYFLIQFWRGRLPVKPEQKMFW